MNLCVMTDETQLKVHSLVFLAHCFKSNIHWGENFLYVGDIDAIHGKGRAQGCL